MNRSASPGAARASYLEVFLLAFAVLVLEIAYTRIVSYKLFYYHTYLVIGLAMLGMGFGGAVVAAWPRLIERFAPIAAAGAALTAVAYLVVARVELSVLAFASSATAPAALALVCAAVFAGFGAIGVLLSSVFASAPERMARLYLADLVGAALGCGIAAPLIATVGAPAAVMLGASTLAVVAASVWRHTARGRSVIAAVGAAFLLAVTFGPSVLPDPLPDPVKTMHPQRLAGHDVLFSAWSPVFRVDATKAKKGPGDVVMLHHDGLWGSALHRWDGDPASLAKFDTDERALPFRTLGRRPERVVIIGAAGGHEVQAALHFQAAHVDAVELNPVTVDLVRRVFADFVGRLGDHPAVTIANDEGRSWLARHAGPFDVVYFVAPDSYAAMNSATSGAFVLSESYLYTVEMIATTLARLAPDGILAMQFGEDDYGAQPNRTIRYVATARAALARLGVADPGRHVAVATTRSLADVSTILVSRSPLDTAPAGRFTAAAAVVPKTTVRWLPGRSAEPGPVTDVLTLDDRALADWIAAYPFHVGPVYDDAPFFWHFARLASVLRGFQPSGPGINWETSAAGERVLVATLVVAAAFAAVCLLVPLVVTGASGASTAVRATAAAYFACLGIGFMLFEVALIQKLALVLGYPTYSLAVTLLSLLVFAGLGSLATERVAGRVASTAGALAVAVVALAAVYAFVLDAVTPALLAMPLAVRIAAALIATAPLGFVLGTFLPLGVSCLTRASAQPAPLVAWAWAVNGFCSVIGSIATTMLAMTTGFRVVFAVAAVVYLVACVLLRRLASVAATWRR